MIAPFPGMSLNPILAFANYELDEDQWELRHGGVPVTLQPKPFALLLYLVRNRGRVVTRRELLSAVWPDVVVTPSSLMRAVCLARAAIGDCGTTIRTYHRRGYRFCLPVREHRPEGQVVAA